jgi:membrane protease YdiL (CAAX protease family)
VPEIPLMLTTFGLGLVYIPLYLRYRNLWPLGLYHGWLGTLFYLWVLGRDPWVETFGIF